MLRNLSPHEEFRAVATAAHARAYTLNGPADGPETSHHLPSPEPLSGFCRGGISRYAPTSSSTAAFMP
jgi:hypothetical protein